MVAKDQNLRRAFPQVKAVYEESEGLLKPLRPHLPHKPQFTQWNSRDYGEKYER